MSLKSMINGNNRQFIRITDVGMLEDIEKLLPYYKTFNRLANDALSLGLPLLIKEKTDPITLPEISEPRKIYYVPDKTLDEMIELLKEIVINTSSSRSMLCGLYNAKVQELEGYPINAERFKRGMFNYVPDCLFDREMDMLKEMSKTERE